MKRFPLNDDGTNFLNNLTDDIPGDILQNVRECSPAVTTVLIMTMIARKIEDNGERFGSRTESQFEYVMGICAVVERHPGPQMLLPLNMLYRHHCLRDLSLPWGRDMRMTVDPILERRAYLEMCIGRAMARCGAAKGFEILARYSNDMRGTLARSATDELTTLLGHPWPVDIQVRAQLLASQMKQPRLQPFSKSID